MTIWSMVVSRIPGITPVRNNYAYSAAGLHYIKPVIYRFNWILNVFKGVQRYDVIDTFSFKGKIISVLREKPRRSSLRVLRIQYQEPVRA